MKKAAILLLLIMMNSCKGQTDLETLRYDQKINESSHEFEKGSSVYVPLEGIYQVKNIDGYQYNGVKFEDEKKEIPNEILIRKNELLIVVDSYSTNKYLGFELYLINEKTADKFLEILKSKYGKPLKQYIYSEGKYKDLQYLWQSSKTNEIIYYNKHNEEKKNSKDKEVLSETRIIILKDKLKAKIDNNNDPQKIKDILSQNPNAFDVLEIFKSQIQER
jgi:hypothetical protein